jgi:predicted O-linked N-acetylglucosamine transferase (SPINDLY family)
VNTWGHSETSGIDTIDYFISSVYFESGGELAQSFYTERLIQLASLSTYYIPPSILFGGGGGPAKLAETSAYPLADIISKSGVGQPHIYGCMQTFYKISAVMIDILHGILARDMEAVILMSNCYPCPDELAHVIIGKYAPRVIWYRELNKGDYMEIIGLCGVHLDPYPFGGCNTSFDAFDMNIPVITMPNSKISGRFTFGLYKKMDDDEHVNIVKDCVASSSQEYIDKAVSITTNVKLRNMISRKIEQGKKAIFSDKKSIADYAELLLSLKPLSI